MIIVGGPTGSGKTTTLYATLSEINRPDINVMTIEDPVEYIFPKVNQIQINEQAGMTFATGLKSILRQDPDVILVGEVRDVETARIAVQSALTGHRVFSSVHAIDAVSSLYRCSTWASSRSSSRRRSSAWSRSDSCAASARRARRRSSRRCRSVTLYEKLGGREKDVWLRGKGCQFCSEHRLLRPGRRVRGARDHRRAPPVRGRRSPAARRTRARRAARSAHAADTKPSAWSRPTSPRWKKS